MVEFGKTNGLIYIDKPESVFFKISRYKYRKEGAKARKFVENNEWDKITSKFENMLKRLM